ncbi:MAG: TIGR02444 family protein [Bradyrhizobiaceae bacterium]|nr:TIGR02444 family protein [Bradyrhizobiaceae bacterium]
MSEPLVLDNPFWRFSLRLYAQEAVRKECLSLQDTFGIDVNILLFTAWLAAERAAKLDEAGVAAIEAVTKPWHAAAVLPLRSARRQVKELNLFLRPEIASLRRKVADLELESEQIEQALLFELAEKRWPARIPAASSTIGGNISAYLARFDKNAAAPALERAAQP